ncbi:MAG: hypothetical protein R3182_14000, partial [Draconibacterium sp.]|nr:hypothetical protein [Draconibacterium sp.]
MNQTEFIMQRKESPAKIGVFGVGYELYWNQFPGLFDELMEKHQILISKIPAENIEIVDFGMIDSPSKAYQVVKEMQAANLDLVFCNMLT